MAKKGGICWDPCSYDFGTPTRLGIRLGPGEEHDRHFVCNFAQ